MVASAVPEEKLRRYRELPFSSAGAQWQGGIYIVFCKPIRAIPPIPVARASGEAPPRRSRADTRANSPTQRPAEGS